MKPRRTHASNTVFRLAGGNEDNDLWVHRAIDGQGYMTLTSVWVPTDEERERIAAGENIELVIWGAAQPPVAMAVTDIELGKPPEPETRP